MKTVLITGAGGNLGGVVVERFLAAGFQVAATVSPGKAPTTVLQSLKYFEVDLTEEKRVVNLVAQVAEKYGGIDAALLLAGGFEAGGIDKTSVDTLQRMFSLNFITAFNVARQVFTKMMEQADGGKIVFIGARAALDAGTGKNMMAYGLSKSLLFKLSEFLTAAGKKGNVFAHVVVPTTIDTPANRLAMPNADRSGWVTSDAIANILLDLTLTKRVDPVIEMGN